MREVSRAASRLRWTAHRTIEDMARVSMPNDPKSVAGFVQQVRGELAKRLEQGQSLERNRAPEQNLGRASGREQDRDR